MYISLFLLSSSQLGLPQSSICTGNHSFILKTFYHIELGYFELKEMWLEDNVFFSDLCVFRSGDVKLGADILGDKYYSQESVIMG